MITRNPDTISYVSVASSVADGETSQSETTVSGIKCSAQPNSGGRYVMSERGDNIVYSYCIMITSQNEIDKLPTANIEDRILISSEKFKILLRKSYQKHVEIYV